MGKGRCLTWCGVGSKGLRYKMQDSRKPKFISFLCGALPGAGSSRKADCFLPQKPTHVRPCFMMHCLVISYYKANV